MSTSTRPGSVFRKIFTAHVALGVAFVITLSAVGAYFATTGPAASGSTFELVAPKAAPPTAVPSVAPPTVVVSTPKPTAKVQAQVVARPAARPASYVAPAPVGARVAPVAGGSQMKTALIIGVGNPVGAQALPGAVADAQNTRSALIADGFPAANIQLLLNNQGTRANIIGGLHSLAARTNRNGTAVFAVSTHSSQSSFRTYEGNRISRSEVASLLGQVPGHLWSLFAVCFADSYNVPGVTGPNRVATFSSAGGEETWESSAGSDFVRAMVKDAMLGGKANTSVEASFNYAANEMHHDGTGHPSMNDQIPGPFVLK